MSYATLMVHLDPAGKNEATLGVAAALAERYGAAAIGVAATDPQPAPYFYGAFGDQVFEQDRARTQAELDGLGERFRAAMQGRASHLEWRSALAPPARYAAREARAADLLIVGATSGGLLADPMVQLDIPDLVMQAGRPVLVVPPEVPPLRFAGAVVAWKDTREARRAASDALPLLRQCASVTVAAIEEDGEEDLARCREGVDDVVAWLRRHGIAAQGLAMLSFGDPAGQLDTIASEHGADVIVAGAYGHSRFSEWVFGGVTRRLLTRVPRCLLLSH